MPSSRTLPALLLLTDLGFLAYWFLTLGKVLPESWMFHGHDDPIVAAWNMSFLPLDLAVSASGLGALAIRTKCPEASRMLLTISLVATSISGLQAITFWSLRRDFDPAWWAPNLFLLLWPLPFLFRRAWMADVRPVAVAQ
jgi:hypothetical protein